MTLSTALHHVEHRMDIPVFDPNTCIFKAYGYELYDHKGKPWVIHNFSTRKTDSNGVRTCTKHTEHLTLDVEGWGGTATARIVNAEMKREWENWVDWNQAMGRG